MRIVRGDRRLSSFLAMRADERIRVNKSYQRSGKVWPLNAKSYLVETVIRGFAVPPFMVHEVSDSDGTHEEIVDGQQRTAALLSFLRNEFRLSNSVDRKGLVNKRHA